MLPEKQCLFCHETFLPVTTRQKFCTAKCYDSFQGKQTTPEESATAMRKAIAEIRPVKNSGPFMCQIGPRFWPQFQAELHRFGPVIVIGPDAEGWRQIETLNGRTWAEVEKHTKEVLDSWKGEEE